MEPSPTGTPKSTTTPRPSAAATFFSDHPSPKLRLLCSYGGQITPRPTSKSLCYLGGETRIVAVDRRTALSFPLLSNHLSRVLLNGRGFCLKYQLPEQDLDSLVSVTCDEDLVNMVEEFERCGSSGTKTRIRFFLFPMEREEVKDLKTESWFLDSLRSTRRFGEEGEKGEAGGAVVVETGSSFGSTGSSGSSTNFPAIRVCGGVVKDENGSGNESGNGVVAVGVDGKGGLVPVDSIGSDSSIASPNFQLENIFYVDSVANLDSKNKAPPSVIETGKQFSDLSHKADLPGTIQPKGYLVLEKAADQLRQLSSPSSPRAPLLQAQSVSPLPQYVHPHPHPQAQTVVYSDVISHHDNSIQLNAFETETNGSDISLKTNPLKKVQVVGYPLAPPTDFLHQQLAPQPMMHPQLQTQPQAPLQYVHPGAHYMPQYYPSPLPTASYPTMYQFNNPYHPVYFMPMGQGQPYDISMQGHMAGTSNIAASLQTLPVVYDGLTPVPSAAEYAAKVYRTGAVSTLAPPVSSGELEQQLMGAFPLGNESSHFSCHFCYGKYPLCW
ncbi:PAL OF QUIRKY-like protein [Drosera capensis]